MQSNKRAGILRLWLLAKLNLARRRMQSIICGAPQSKSFGKCSCAAAARETKLSNQADNAALGDSGLHCRFRAALRLIKSLCTGFGAQAQSYSVKFFNKSSTAPAVPLTGQFDLPPPWSPENPLPASSSSTISYADLELLVTNATTGAAVSGVTMQQAACTGANSTSIAPQVAGGISTQNDGRAVMRLRIQNMVVPSGNGRVLTCAYVLAFPNGTNSSPTLNFVGPAYIPVDLSVQQNAQAVTEIDGEGTIQVIAKHKTAWLPPEFSTVQFSQGWQIANSNCVITNPGPNTASTITMSGPTDASGVALATLNSVDLHVRSTLSRRTGTCKIELQPGSVGAAYTTPLYLSLQGNQWALNGNNSTNDFPISQRGGPVSFRILLNGQGRAPAVSQTVISDASIACTSTTPSTTTFTGSGNTTNVLGSFVSGGTTMSVAGPLNVPNQSINGQCRFRLQNHRDVYADVKVRGLDVCLDTTLAEPRPVACLTGVSKQVLVIDIASVDGGVSSGTVSTTATAGNPQTCLGSRCVFEYPQGSVVNITANPAAQSGVVSWEYDCSSSIPPPSNLVSVPMDRSRHCSLRFGPRTTGTQLIGACPSNYSSTLYRFDYPAAGSSRVCLTSLEALEANLAIGTIFGDNGYKYALAFPAIVPTMQPNGRIKVSLGGDYRGSGNYLGDISNLPNGTLVRSPATPVTAARRRLLLNNWPSASLISTTNAGCAGGASNFGFGCKSWTDETARFESARQNSGWCVQTKSLPSVIGTGTVRTVRAPSLSTPNQSVLLGILNRPVTTPATYSWKVCGSRAPTLAASTPSDVPEQIPGDEEDSFSCPMGSVPNSDGNCTMEWSGKAIFGGDNPGDGAALTQEPECTRGNPCGPGSGNKSINEQDFSLGAFTFSRHSKRQLRTYASLGLNWSHNYAWRLLTPRLLPAHNANAAGPDVSVIFFQNEKTQLEVFRKLSSGVFRAEKSIGLILRYQSNDQSWILFYPDGHFLKLSGLGLPTQLVYPEDPGNSLSFTHNSFDQLTQVQDGRGRILSFIYEAPAQVNNVPLARRFNANLVQVALQGVAQVSYEYDDLDRLITVRYPGNKTRAYKYAETNYADAIFKHHITGVFNERGERYASYKYDALGRVIDSWHGNDFAGRVQLCVFLPIRSPIPVHSGQ
jgi:YD repeat-containing protein